MVSRPHSARVSVPATSANFGPGFDAIGVALDLRGEIELSLADPAPASRSAHPEPVVSQPAHPEPVEGGAATADRGRRMVFQAVERVFRHIGQPVPLVQIGFHSDVPVARGLGASAILRVGAALAASALAGVPEDREWMLQLAAELEGHA
ncbi:MAG TPA: hypothetical protein VK821_08825, partial [Dehalococcoidia bacterium]|nr:hypothetical protein [Dehalococcoidia bacterium]